MGWRSGATKSVGSISTSKMMEAESWQSQWEKRKAQSRQ